LKKILSWDSVLHSKLLSHHDVLGEDQNMSAGALYTSVPAGPINANVATAQLFPNRQVPSLPVTLNVLGSGRLEQRKWTARASGSATTGVESTVTVSLYAAKTLPATPFVAADWTLVAASTARTIDAATAGWEIEASLMFESVGGTLQGTFQDMIDNLYDAAAAITGTLTGLNGTSNKVTQPGDVVVIPAEPVFYLTCGLTFGTANVDNSAVLGDFSLLPAS
jgi:hypothetical protein